MQTLSIEDLRNRIDKMDDKLLALISTRIKYPLNRSTFEEEFSDKQSWFLYRLKKEQDLDSEFGRFLYNDQIPFVYKKEELKEAKIPAPKNSGLNPIDLDLSEKIIPIYQRLLETLCVDKKNDTATFGETTKLDVEILLTINERTTAIGEHVSAFKLESEPELKSLSAEEIRKKLIKPEREKEVIDSVQTTAEKYGIRNNEAIKEFTKGLIEITLDSEVEFILNS